jgi:hypothetical protein
MHHARNKGLALGRPVRSRLFTKLAAGLLALAAAPLLHADPVLRVDLGGGATQSGFQAWNIGTDGAGPKSTTFTATDLASVPTGTVALTLAGGSDAANTANDTLSLNTRTRVGAPANSGAFTQADLMVDRVVTTGGGAGTGLFLQLTGFAPNTPSAVQVWGYDTQAAGGAKPGNFNLLDRTNGANTSLGTFAATAGQLPTDNNTFSVSGTVTSDVTGKIVLETVSNIDGNGIANGFVISTAVPEPTGALLVTLACTPLVRRRRSAR